MLILNRKPGQSFVVDDMKVPGRRLRVKVLGIDSDGRIAVGFECLHYDTPIRDDDCIIVREEKDNGHGKNISPGQRRPRKD